MPSIMNRISKESFFGGKFSQAGSQSRKGRSKASVAPADDEADENLDLFSKNRQSLSLSYSDQSAALEPLRRISFTSGKVLRSGLDDLIASAEREKHDYDWLLTPPGTPLDPSSDGQEPQATLAPSKRNVLARSHSVCASNASSRLSVSQSESNPPSRLARSSSVTRSLYTASQFSTYSSIMSSSILNTSSASVSSYVRPSSPIRQSFSSARPITSPSATPSRASLIPRCASVDRSRKSAASAPSPKIQIPASSNSSASRSKSRGSTPTRRISAMSPSSLSSSTSFMARLTPTRRTAAPRSCPSSPGPRVRASTPMDLHLNFPDEVLPNLRISLPNRALSTGRTRPGLPSLRANSEKVSSHNARSRQFSPIAIRGKPSESGVRGPPNFNEHKDMPVARRIPVASESTMRKPGKSSANAVPEINEFRRTISRKSSDMSVRHMDNKVSAGRVQSVSGGILYPHSTHPAAASKSQVARTLPPSVSGSNKTKLVGNRGANSENAYCIRSHSVLSIELQERDIFENYQYDASLLEGDLKSTNWLCSFEDNSDDSGLLMFEKGLALLPEPFGPL